MKIVHTHKQPVKQSMLDKFTLAFEYNRSVTDERKATKQRANR